MTDLISKTKVLNGAAGIGQAAEQIHTGLAEMGIAEVSHELRLPIANLKLLVETLLSGAGEDKNMREHFLLKAQSEIERLQALVVNLLQSEQVSALGTDYQLSLNNFACRVQSALEPLQKAIAEKQLQVELVIESDWQIYANCQQLDQVLLNLLENAVKFTSNAGKITIASGPVPGAFTIIDTGMGMAACEIPKIFQRFYRIDRGQFRGSTGLGLSIVKHILDLHGAKISVFSQEGVGSQFQVEFPGPGCDKAVS